MSRTKEYLTFVAFVLAFCSSAATYYVDAEKGNDGWDGSSSTAGEGNVGPKRTWEGCKELLTAENDVLVFAKGRYPVESEWTPSVKNLKFKGATGNRDDITLDGQGQTRFIVKTSGDCQYDFCDLTISNFCAKTKCDTDKYGYDGGFCRVRSNGKNDNGSNLYMTNVHATCCSAPYGAGGVALVRQIETHDSLFDFNTATNGGAFATSGNSGGTYFYDSTFRTNSATVKSGVVYVYAAASPFSCYGSRFEGNRASLAGVANFATPIVTNSFFVANRATNGDAGVMELNVSNSQSVYPIVDCWFIGNEAANGNGGALSFSSPNWKIVGCHFLTNSCDRNGGAVYGITDAAKAPPR